MVIVSAEWSTATHWTIKAGSDTVRITANGLSSSVACTHA